MANKSDEKNAKPALKPYLDLFWISFITLYAEMLLIRWIGVEVRIFAYLSNFILIACFLGFGIGCFQSNKPFRPLNALLIMFAIVFFVSEPFGIRIIPFTSITQILGGGLTDMPIWDTWLFGSTGRKILFMGLGTGLTILLFGMVVFSIVPFGRRIGRLFDEQTNTVAAYSVNIFGSLCGSWAFTGLSFLQTPPWFWYLLLAIGLLVYVPRRAVVMSVYGLAGAAMVACLLVYRTQPGDAIWSPYQKLVISDLMTDDEKVQRGYQINVNNTGYQLVLDLSEEFLAKHPEYFDLTEAKLGHYDLPYRFAPKPERVLIVGAGAGNDCAGALRNGAGIVDCVEIDPVIAKLGKQFHPEKPYDNPNVNLIIDDARSYFGKTTNRYDMVWFGLLDSHTLGSAYNNVRLDHYVYTKESFESARDILNDDGVIVLFFQADAEWIQHRLYGLLDEVFGHPPLSYRLKTKGNHYGWGGTLYITGKQSTDAILAKAPATLVDFMSHRKIDVDEHVKLTTDNWPFMYLQGPRIPSLHILVSVCLFLIFLVLRKQILNKSIRFDWRFFCLGAGFLLVEVQSVTKAGLLFGSTWITNSLIISQILIWILLSNLIYAKWKVSNLKIIFALLFADLLLLYFVPVSLFSGLPLAGRVILGSVHLTLPVFFAGLIFINLFNNTPRKDSALGANLLGALGGGLLESTAFLFGQRSLLIPAALFYLAVFLLMRRSTKQ